MRLALAGLGLMVCTAGGVRAEGEMTLPSGQEVTFVEMIQDAAGPAGLTYRFRFLAPAIARDGGTVDADAALADMAYLCTTYALPRLANIGPRPEQIVISLADRAVDFGATDPDATQFFEAFRPEGETCLWEGF